MADAIARTHFANVLLNMFFSFLLIEGVAKFNAVDILMKSVGLRHRSAGDLSVTLDTGGGQRQRCAEATPGALFRRGPAVSSEAGGRRSQR
jgi:hypothetical protein